MRDAGCGSESNSTSPIRLFPEFCCSIFARHRAPGEDIKCQRLCGVEGYTHCAGQLSDHWSRENCCTFHVGITAIIVLERV